MLPILSERLAAAGRRREDFHVNLYAYVAIAADRRRAIDDARGTVAFYSSIAQYQKYYAAHGFGDAARAVVAAAARNDPRAMVAAVPDEMVDTFLVAGTAEEAKARVAELAGYADSITLLPPGTGGSLPADRVAEYRNAIAATFYPGRRKR
jgi:alkanesulfonate monooxygenase SsuD/methylene tetrahydromethanopterin reductase-like flavin-dependent oxidoreductase (luciferase family)